MTKYTLMLLLVALSGCATTSIKEYQAPDGTAIKTVKCTSDPAKCFALATASCQTDGKYRVLTSESHAGGIGADLIPGPITWYSMTYACGISDGKMPDFKFAGQQYTPIDLAPPPLTMRQQPTTTNCTKIGNSTNCTTY